MRLRKPTCNCRAQGLADCNHPRIYSQPDCDSGWDSAREKFFNGYHLYLLSAADSQYDLPLYPRLQPASRHDAISLVVSAVEFKQRFTLGTVQKMLLDAAHDAMAIYELLRYQNIEPFIDLNVRGTKNLETDGDILTPVRNPVLLLNPVERFILVARTIHDCFRKHQGVRENGNWSTNAALLLNAPINAKRLITNWNPVGTALRRCGTYAFTAS